MIPRIGVFGAATNWEPHAENLAKELGEELARRSVTVVTGATSGLPLFAAKAAMAKGATVIGISPAKNAKDHLEVFKRPLDSCTQIIFTGMGMPLRNVLNAYNTDGMIAVGGEIGTMQELCVGVFEGKVVGVLEGSGGISSIFRQVIDACKKDYGAKFVYGTDPKELVTQVLDAIAGRMK